MVSGHWMPFIFTEIGAKWQGVGEASAPPPHPSQPTPMGMYVIQGIGERRRSTYGVCCKAVIEPLAFDATTYDLRVY